MLAITGSNGKTTVTALTGELAAAAGLATTVVGNIGEPVLDALAEHERRRAWPDVFVLELSSFQLETTSSLRRPRRRVLNVTENHLDRYAGIDAYAAAKARIFAGGGEQVLNRDDPRSLAMPASGPRGADLRRRRSRGRSATGALVQHGATRRGSRAAARCCFAASDLTLVGRHNALNALAALALVSTVAKIDAKVLAALAAFAGCRTGWSASPKSAASSSSTIPRARRSPRRRPRSPASGGRPC